jgi:hypothetical protein
MNYEFIEQAGTLYIVIRKIKESSDPIIDDWKEYLLADKVFRKDGLLYFCRTVDDVEFTEIHGENGEN